MYSDNLSTSNKYVKYRIKTVETKNDPTNNKTKIKVTVEAWRTNTGYETYGAGTCYVNINGTNYSQAIKSSQKITYNSYTELFSKEVEIDHNPDGSKTIYVASYIDHASFTSSSQGYNVTLTKYPRMATLTYAPSFTDEENPTITYSNPAGEVVDSLQACIATDGGTVLAEYRDIPKTGTSYTFNLTEEERSRLRYATLNMGTTIPIKFFVTTVIGENTYYSPQSKTLKIVNATPEITCNVEDVGAASLALTGNKDILIKGFNYVMASMSSVCKKGATIESQTITNGSAQLVGETGGNHSMEGGFNNAESGDFIFSLTDNRGITVNQTITKQVIPYVKLTCNLKPNKPNAEGELTFNVSGNYWVGNFGAIDNYLAVEYRIKAEDSDWSGWTLINDDYSIQNNTYSVDVDLSGLDYKKAYTLQARAQDRVELIPSAERTVKAIPVFDWNDNDFTFNVPVNFNASVNFDGGNLVDLVYPGLVDLIYPVGAIYISSIEVNPEALFGGKWAKLEDAFLLGASANYPEGSTGGEATHILTLEEIPNHRHGQCFGGSPQVTSSGVGDSIYGNVAEYNSSTTAKRVMTDYNGGGKAHNNMPPYLAVHMWKRYE